MAESVSKRIGDIEVLRGFAVLFVILFFRINGDRSDCRVQ